MSFNSVINLSVIPMKCKSCSYQFDPLKEGNSKQRKCGMCCFGDSYSVRSSKKEYESNLLFVIIESQ
jgi:hypothetical protein